MYVLEDGTSLTNQIKEAFKRGLTRAYIKVGNTIIDQSNYLVNAKYKDEKADPETGAFIGVTSMRELDIKLLNIDNTLNLENADIEYHIGALVGEEYKYINLGNFIVQKPTNEEVNEEMTFTALDYMSKFDTDDPYEPQVIFPTTLLGLAQDVCSQAGVALGNTDFRNADKQILANPFVNGENMRTVLKSIAKLSFSCGYIGQDNKLYFGFDISDEVTESITIDDYIENKPNNEIKPITALTLRSSEIKTVGQTIYDTEHIVEYGTNELLIEEDYIAYTDELRLAYLNGARDLFGLTYKPLSIDVLGSVYLSFNDVIEVTNLQGEKHKTYALNNTHEYNGTLYNTITTPSVSEVEERYKYETEDVNSRRRTNVNINKAEQRIELIETEIGDRSEKTSSITQEIDSIELTISDLEDLTVDVEGINPLTLENCLEGELIRLNIKGNNTVFSGLVPSNSLVPSNELVPYGDSYLYIYTKNKCPTKNEAWTESLNTDGTIFSIYNSELVEIDNNYSAYFSIKGDKSFVLYNIQFYDKKKNYLGNYYNYFDRDVNTKGLTNAIVFFPKDTKYIRYYLRKKDIEDNFVSFTEYDVQDIKPMLEYVSKYKNDNTYSGNLSNYYIQIDALKNYQHYSAASSAKATETTEFEIDYIEYENQNTDSVIIGTGDDNYFAFYTKTDGNYNEKLLTYNGTNYAINTTNTFLNIRTTLSFKLDNNTGNYILTLSDENEHIETFDIPSTTTFTSTNSFSIMSNNSNSTKCNVTLYGFKIWNNSTLVENIVCAIHKSTGRVATVDLVTNSYRYWSDYSSPGVVGVTEFIAPDIEFQNYNYQVIDLGIIEPLRQFSPTVYDEFDYDSEHLYNFDEEDDGKEYKAIVTRRVGVTPGGEMYELANPIYEAITIPDIMLVEGINYINLSKPYSANMKATYVQITTFTKIFATQYQVTSQIIQLANSISLIVAEKVGKDEVIAQINVAVEDHQGIIRITGNQIIIQSDYFKLSETGYITATGGTVGGITLSSNMLYKRYTQSGANYESGLNLPDSVGSTGNYPFLYAGRPVGENLVKSNMFIHHNGNVFFRSGSLSMIYEPTINQDGSSSWYNAMNFQADAINRYLPNGNRWTFDGVTYLNGVAYGHRLSIYDAQIYTIHDGVHDLLMAGFRRVGNNLEQSRIDFYGPTYVDGSPVQTGTSDERLKENIEKSNISALKIVDDIDFYSFDWKDENKGHIDIGFIAQRLQKQYNKLVIHSDGTNNKGEKIDTYQIDLLNTLAVTMKAVQELSKKVEDLEEEIRKLKGE